MSTIRLRIDVAETARMRGQSAWPGHWSRWCGSVPWLLALLRAGSEDSQCVGRVKLVRTGAAVATIGLGSGLLFATPLSVIIGFAVLGAGLANIIPVIFTASAEQGATPAEGISGTATLGYLGILAGPPLIGGIAELTNLTIGLSIVVVLLGVVTASSSALGQKRGAQPAST